MRRFRARGAAFLPLVLVFGCSRASVPADEPPRSSRPPVLDVADAAPPNAHDEASRGEQRVNEPTPRPFFYANEDPDDDRIVAPPLPREHCEEELKAAQIRYRRASIPVHHEKKNSFACGAEQVVTYLGGPEKISYNAPPTLTCTLALALARFETIAQEESLRSFKKRIARFDHLGTYACREMAAYRGWVSEHSYANAIDLEKVTLEGGREISVLKFFEKTDEPAKRPEGAFLRRLAERSYDEGTFSTVLTSFFDALHRDHFHLDMARYRTDGSRPCAIGGC